MARDGMRGWAAVTGVAERKPTRWTDGETTIDMVARIGVEAIADAGLELADIDGLVCHPMGGVPMLVPSTIGEAMGLRVSYAATVDLGGATGAGMVWRAAAAIHAGSGPCRAVRDRGSTSTPFRHAAQTQRPIARARYLGVGRVRGSLRQRRRQRRLRHDRQPLPLRARMLTGAAGEDRRPPARQRVRQSRRLLLRTADHGRRRAGVATRGRPPALVGDRHALGRRRRAGRGAPRSRRAPRSARRRGCWARANA